MKVKDINRAIEEIMPKQLRMDGDPNGILVGDPNSEVTNILLSLNVTEEVVDEAIEKRSQLIVSHHPLFFSPMKKMVKGDYYSDIIMKMIKHNISFIAHHTNFDIVDDGVSSAFAKKLNLKNLKPLVPLSHLKKGKFIENYKLVVYLPKGYESKIKDTITKGGGGSIGEYDYCFFQSEGLGSFRGGENSDPFIGDKGKISEVDEIKIETIVPAWKIENCLNKIKEVHPYEEVAYDLIPMEIESNRYGLGIVGDLKECEEFKNIAKKIKDIIGVEKLRAGIVENQKPIKKIAIIGGSGGKYVSYAISQNIDLVISSEISHHTFLEAKNKINIIDITHHSSEKFAIEKLSDYLKHKFQNINVLISELDMDPISEI